MKRLNYKDYFFSGMLMDIFFFLGPTNQTLNDAQCAEQGADFCGNRMDYRMPPDPRVFLMCYNGKYVDCMECQYGLQFLELRNFRNESDLYGHCAWPTNISTDVYANCRFYVYVNM